MAIPLVPSCHLLQKHQLIWALGGGGGASLAAVKLWIMHIEPWHLQL